MSESVWGTDSGLWPVMPEPLVPSREDLALYVQACPPALLREDAAPRVLVLGVTPALADLPWPPKAELHAVDYDEVMVKALWHPREGAQVHLARWQEMPFEDGYFDLIIGDCSFNALSEIADYTEVLREVARVSRSGAPLIARFFMQSEPPPNLAWIAQQVPEALAHYRAASKRVLVALACAEDDGTFHMAAVRDRIGEQWGDYEDYLKALGGPPEDFELSKLVFGYDQRLNYPTERAITERFAPFYRDISFAYPAYDAGRYCPIVRFA
jgi:hypothetical protein